MAVCPPRNMVARLLHNTAECLLHSMAVCPLHSMAAYLRRNTEACQLPNTEVYPLHNMAASQHLSMVVYQVLKAVVCQLPHLTFIKATFRPGLCFFENLRRGVISLRQGSFASTYRSFSGRKTFSNREAAATPQQRQNKALHPTAYSFVSFARASLRSLRFRRRVSLVVSWINRQKTASKRHAPRDLCRNRDKQLA